MFPELALQDKDRGDLGAHRNITGYMRSSLRQEEEEEREINI